VAAASRAGVAGAAAAAADATDATDAPVITERPTNIADRHEERFISELRTGTERKPEGRRDACKARARKRRT
jgi:hypothetical protein